MPAHHPPRASTRTGSSLGLASALLLGALVPASPALAHAGPEVLRLLWRDGGDGLVMVTNRGVLFGETTDRSFRLMCMQAIGISPSERPDVALLPDGGVMIAASAGVGLTRDEGCTWQGVAPFSNVMSPALAQDPAAPQTLYLASFAPPDGGGIHVSHDAGATWSRLLKTAENDFVQELVVAPSDSSSIYAAGQVFAEGEPTTHYVARSTDAGEHWERFELSVADSEVDVALLAVNPVDPMMLLAATTTLDPLVTQERLLISRDGGASFSTAFETQLIHDASFSADGETLWVAGSMGMWRSDGAARRFEKLQGPLYTSCVTVHDGTLWSCGLFAPDQDGVGALVDQASGFEPRMLFTDVEQPVACETSSPTATRCAGPWQQWEREVLDPVVAGGGGRRPAAGSGGADGADAGAGVDAGADASAGHAALGTSTEAEGCTTLGHAGRHATAGWLAQLGFVLAIALGWLRRRSNAVDSGR
jgi:hypothetical protein